MINTIKYKLYLTFSFMNFLKQASANPIHVKTMEMDIFNFTDFISEYLRCNHLYPKHTSELRTVKGNFFNMLEFCGCITLTPKYYVCAYID